ncbi:MAG TPA: cytochrome c [Opitutaceae bacterium]|nr:cytochrome c [Opitutaceae bacterium]
MTAVLPLTPRAALIAAMVGAAAALGSAYAGARGLQLADARRSHALPSPDRWADPPDDLSAAAQAGGRKLYLRYCAHCHGADATGDEGPDLHDEEVSDRYIARTILKGIPHQMPSFAKKFGAAETRELTAYLRTLD